MPSCPECVQRHREPLRERRLDMLSQVSKLPEFYIGPAIAGQFSGIDCKDKMHFVSEAQRLIGGKLHLKDE